MADHDSGKTGSDRPAGSRRRLFDAAAGPLHPTARQTLIAALEAGWADPARLYAEGRRARALVDTARQVIAAGLGARPPEVSFLPSGPAALTRALDGLTYAAQRRGARVVASAVEHSAILVPGRARAARSGDPDHFDEVRVDELGAVDLEAWAHAVALPGTVAAALQHANSEVGTRQPLVAAHARTRESGIPLLVDATSSLGRDEVPAAWDVLVGDAQSWGGPPLGVLVVREGVRWHWGGARADVEHGRSDVGPWVPLALAAAEAWQQVAATRVADAAGARECIDEIRVAAGAVPDTQVVGAPQDRLPHVCTFSSLFVDGEVLVHDFDRQGFAVASGSACTSSTLAPSHVLAAMGVLTHGNLRVTLPLPAVAPALPSDVHDFCAAIAPTVARVRASLGVTDL